MGGRTDYSKDDDRALARWILNHGFTGAMSDNYYKGLEEKLPHHSIQSWRQRYKTQRERINRWIEKYRKREEEEAKEAEEAKAAKKAERERQRKQARKEKEREKAEKVAEDERVRLLKEEKRKVREEAERIVREEEEEERERQQEREKSKMKDKDKGGARGHQQQNEDKDLSGDEEEKVAIVGSGKTGSGKRKEKEIERAKPRDDENAVGASSKPKKAKPKEHLTARQKQKEMMGPVINKKANPKSHENDEPEEEEGEEDKDVQDTLPTNSNSNPKPKPKSKPTMNHPARPPLETSNDLNRPHQQPIASTSKNVIIPPRSHSRSVSPATATAMAAPEPSVLSSRRSGRKHRRVNYTEPGQSSARENTAGEDYEEEGGDGGGGSSDGSDDESKKPSHDSESDYDEKNKKNKGKNLKRVSSPVISRARKPRVEFTDEDDECLANWVWKVKKKGGVGLAGNNTYQELEEVNSRHTWQAWRNRFIKGDQQYYIDLGARLDRRRTRKRKKEKERERLKKEEAERNRKEKGKGKAREEHENREADEDDEMETIERPSQGKEKHDQQNTTGEEKDTRKSKKKKGEQAGAAEDVDEVQSEEEGIGDYITSVAANRSQETKKRKNKTKQKDDVSERDEDEDLNVDMDEKLMEKEDEYENKDSEEDKREDPQDDKEQKEDGDEGQQRASEKQVRSKLRQQQEEEEDEDEADRQPSEEPIVKSDRDRNQEANDRREERENEVEDETPAAWRKKKEQIMAQARAQEKIEKKKAKQKETERRKRDQEEQSDRAPTPLEIIEDVPTVPLELQRHDDLSRQQNHNVHVEIEPPPPPQTKMTKPVSHGNAGKKKRKRDGDGDEDANPPSETSPKNTSGMIPVILPPPSPRHVNRPRAADVVAAGLRSRSTLSPAKGDRLRPHSRSVSATPRPGASTLPKIKQFSILDIRPSDLISGGSTSIPNLDQARQIFGDPEMPRKDGSNDASLSESEPPEDEDDRRMVQSLKKGQEVKQQRVQQTVDTHIVPDGLVRQSEDPNRDEEDDNGDVTMRPSTNSRSSVSSLSPGDIHPIRWKHYQIVHQNFLQALGSANKPTSHTSEMWQEPEEQGKANLRGSQDLTQHPSSKQQTPSQQVAVDRMEEDDEDPTFIKPQGPDPADLLKVQSPPTAPSAPIRQTRSRTRGESVESQASRTQIVSSNERVTRSRSRRLPSMSPLPSLPRVVEEIRPKKKRKGNDANSGVKEASQPVRQESEPVMLASKECSREPSPSVDASQPDSIKSVDQFKGLPRILEMTTSKNHAPSGVPAVVVTDDEEHEPAPVPEFDDESIRQPRSPSMASSPPPRFENVSSKLPLFLPSSRGSSQEKQHISLPSEQIHQPRSHHSQQPRHTLLLQPSRQESPRASISHHQTQDQHLAEDHGSGDIEETPRPSRNQPNKFEDPRQPRSGERQERNFPQRNGNVVKVTARQENSSPSSHLNSRTRSDQVEPVPQRKPKKARQLPPGWSSDHNAPTEQSMTSQMISRKRTREDASDQGQPEEHPQKRSKVHERQRVSEHREAPLASRPSKARTSVHFTPVQDHPNISKSDSRLPGPTPAPAPRQSMLLPPMSEEAQPIASTFVGGRPFSPMEAAPSLPSTSRPIRQGPSAAQQEMSVVQRSSGTRTRISRDRSSSHVISLGNPNKEKLYDSISATARECFLKESHVFDILYQSSCRVDTMQKAARYFSNPGPTQNNDHEEVLKDVWNYNDDMVLWKQRHGEPVSQQRWTELIRRRGISSVDKRRGFLKRMAWPRPVKRFPWDHES